MVRRYLGGATFGIVIAVMLVVTIPGVILAQAPGDVGSLECRAVQLEAQAAVDAGQPYKNHGKMVSTAAKVQSPYVEDGTITEECSSCIINQFARRIATTDQTACGPDVPVNPECAPATCATFIPCNEGGNCGSYGVCVSIAEGGGTCLYGPTPCAGLTLCPGGTTDCGAGEICAVNTCCGDPVCVPGPPPDDFFCWPAGATSTEATPSSSTAGPTVGK